MEFLKTKPKRSNLKSKNFNKVKQQPKESFDAANLIANMSFSSKPVVKQSSCPHIKLSGSCDWQSRHLLKIPNSKPCNICSTEVTARKLAGEQPDINQLIPQDMVDLMTVFKRKCLPYQVIGAYMDYACYPYESMDGYTNAAEFGEQSCINCESGMPESYTSRFSCYCPNSFKVTKHILIETVTYEQWDLIMDAADAYNIYIYVHDLCSMPFVKPYTQQNISVYVPKTQRCKIEEMEHSSEVVTIAGCHIQIRKPIISDAIAKFKGLWTRRYMQRRAITYASKTVITTDDTLKYVDSVIAGAKFTKPEHIVDQVARVKKDIQHKLKDDKCSFRREIVKLHKLSYNEANETIFALVLNYAAMQTSMMDASENWLASFDNGAFSTLFSTENNHIVSNEMVPVPATCGNKVVPLQVAGSTVTIINHAVGEKTTESSYIQIGPNVNGYGRIVPPKTDIQTVVNSLECRQNAQALPEHEPSQETTMNFKIVLDEMREHCKFTPSPIESIPEGYSGVKKMRYRKALNNIKDNNCLANPDKINTTRKSFIKEEPLYKIKPDVPVEVAFRVIQGVSDEATLTTMPLIQPLSKQLAKLPETTSILNKFTYTSGLDANQVGAVVHKALEACNHDYFIIEGDFTLYDASQRKWCHQMELDILETTCEDKNTLLYSAAYNVIERQERTTGFFHNRKSGAVVKYTTPYTRKSGDSNTSEGNSSVNIAATFDVYSQLEIYAELERCLILGDDNLSIFRGDIPDYGKGDLNEKHFIQLIEEQYAQLGLKIKVKISRHIAKAEFCNMIFAPIVVNGEDSLTLIAKLGRLMLKFNCVKKSSIKNADTTHYVFDNLYAIRNTLQFYSGVSCYNRLLVANDKIKAKPVEQSNELFKTPQSVYEPNFQLWDAFVYKRYGLFTDDLHTDANMFEPTEKYVSWFNDIAIVDLQ